MFQQGSTEQQGSRSSSAAEELDPKCVTTFTANLLHPTTSHPLALTTYDEETSHVKTLNEMKSRKPVILRGNNNISITPQISKKLLKLKLM